MVNAHFFRFLQITHKRSSAPVWQAAEIHQSREVRENKSVQFPVSGFKINLPSTQSRTENRVRGNQHDWMEIYFTVVTVGYQKSFTRLNSLRDRCVNGADFYFGEERTHANCLKTAQ